MVVNRTAYTKALSILQERMMAKKCVEAGLCPYDGAMLIKRTEYHGSGDGVYALTGLHCPTCSNEFVEEK